MLQSYDDKLKQAKWKRDLALARMRLAKIQATTAIEQTVTHKVDTLKAAFHEKVDGLKAEYHHKVDNFVAKFDPNNVVRKHPWGAALGMAGLGLLLVPVFRAIFVPASRVKHHAQPPQRVVVEVVGAPQPKQRKASAFSGIVDAALHSLSGLISFAQAHLANMHQQADGNGKGKGKGKGKGSMDEPATETAVETAPEPASNPQAKPAQPQAKPAQPQTKHPSISRRTAPPPQQ